MALLSTLTRRLLVRRTSRRFWVGFLIASGCLVGGPNLPGQTGISTENKVKSTFLYNFAQFVQWPAEAFPEAETTLVIGILGTDPFGGYLDEIVRGEKLNNRTLVIQRYQRVEEIKICHILFVSQSETNRWDQIFTSVKGRGILTVGDVEDFTRRGGMIRFVTEKNKIRFRVNLEMAKAENLTISSKLLRSAEITGPGKD